VYAWIFLVPFEAYLRLEIPKQCIYESSKKLVDKGILIKGLKVGRHQTYRLNAFYGWKGKADKKYWDECEKHSKAQ
jgi:hypothetical protein